MRWGVPDFRKFVGTMADGSWLTLTGDELPAPMLLRIGDHNGRPVCTGLVIGFDVERRGRSLEVSAGDEREITKRLLGAIPLRAILEELTADERLRFNVPPVRPPARRRPGRGGHDEKYYVGLARTHRELAKKLKRPPSIEELRREFREPDRPGRSTLYRHLQTARERGYLKESE